MPQSNIFSAFKNSLGKLVPGLVDANTGTVLVSRGGTSSAINVTAAAVLKASAGRVGKIIVVAPGTTSGSLTINDCASTGAATGANEIFTIGYAGLSAGQVIELDFPVVNGVVVSAVPGAGSPQFSISFT